MKTIHYYFDFISPYSYLSNFRLPDLAAQYGYEIVYHPIDLKAAKLAAGNDGPATAQMPKKMRYAFADLMRWAKKYNAPLAMVAEGGIPDPTKANIGTFYAIDRNQAAAYVTEMWRATFGSGARMDSPDALAQVATTMGWDAQEFLQFIESDEAAQRYAQENQVAQDSGVFGAPIMVVGEEMWWGNDRLDLMEEHLAELG